MFSLFKLLLKYIPTFIVVLYLSNTLLSYIDEDNVILTYILHYSMFLFILIASVVFRFCKWHRLCIYSALVCDIINNIYYYSDIDEYDMQIIMINITLCLISLLIALKYKFI